MFLLCEYSCFSLLTSSYGDMLMLNIKSIIKWFFLRLLYRLPDQQNLNQANLTNPHGRIFFSEIKFIWIFWSGVEVRKGWFWMMMMVEIEWRGKSYKLVSSRRGACGDLDKKLREAVFNYFERYEWFCNGWFLRLYERIRDCMKE